MTAPAVTEFGVVATHPSATRSVRRRTARLLRRVFAPRPKLTVSEWADRYRYLPRESSSEHGKWRTSRVPYAREIMDVLGDPLIPEVILMASAQIAKTEIGLNLLGYFASEQPCPCLVVMPTDKLADTYSTNRLEPSFRDSPRLHGLLTWSARRSGANTKSEKHFPGGFIAFTTARSASGLANRPIRLLVLEEVDRYPPSLSQEGDPVAVATKRTNTFWNRKVYKNSTPTSEEESRIAKDWAKSDQRRYVVPCPHCGHEQTLDWRRDDKPDTLVRSIGLTAATQLGSYGLVFERTPERSDGSGKELIPESVKYACAGCGGLIDERDKGQMLERGRWVAMRPGAPVAGFHINALYSPWVSWAEVVKEFLEAKDDGEKLRSFDNLTLGLPYREKGVKLDPTGLAKRVEDYGAEVPRGVGILTSYVDIQGNRLEAFVWGWGAREECWFIDWITVEGDPALDATWKALDERVLFRTWKHRSGAPMKIDAMAVDSGYLADAAYKYAEARRGYNVFATKGVGGSGRILWGKQTEGAATKSKARHRGLVSLGVDGGKDTLASRLRIAAPGPGYIHFHNRTDVALFQQVTAEEKVVQTKKVGRALKLVRVWMPLPGRTNEGLDGWVGAYACLSGLGADVVANLDGYARKANEWVAPEAGVPRPQGTGRRMRHRGLDS